VGFCTEGCSGWPGGELARAGELLDGEGRRVRPESYGECMGRVRGQMSHV